MDVYKLSASITLDTDDYKSSVTQVKKSSEELRSDVAKLAAAYKKEGLDSSAAMKKAWAEIDRSQYESVKTSKKMAEEFGDNWEGQAPKIISLGDAIKANILSDAIISGVKKIASAVVDVGKASLAAYGDYEQLVGGAQLMFGDAYDYISQAHSFLHCLRRAPNTVRQLRPAPSPDAPPALVYE